jgi:hypothetical protein
MGGKRTLLDLPVAQHGRAEAPKIIVLTIFSDEPVRKSEGSESMVGRGASTDGLTIEVVDTFDLAA